MRWFTTAALAAAFCLSVAGGAQGFEFLEPYQGPVTMKFNNWDVGTEYDVDDGLYTGQSTLDALAQTPPAAQFGNEDSWGVHQLTEITGSDNQVLWSRAIPGTPEVTGIFWGLRDTYLDQTTTTAGVSQDIHGVGLHLALYEDPANDLGNPSGLHTGSGLVGTDRRTAEHLFAGATEGTLLWTLNSVPGFDGNFLDDEFFTTYFPSGEGFGGLNAWGGMWAELGAIHTPGPDGVMDTGDDVILEGTMNDLFVGADEPGADWRLSFTGKVDPTGQFQILSSDPADTEIVPEPATIGLIALGVAGLVAKRRR